MSQMTRVGLVALSIATVSLALSTEPSAQQPPGLFVDVVGPAAADQRMAADRTRIRSRTVRVDLPQLGTRDSRSDAGTLQLNLFDDASYRAVRDRIDLTPGGFVWVGHIAGVEMSTVSLATEEGVMSGLIQTPDGTYTIDFAGNGLHSIVQIDQSAFPQGAEPLEVPALPASAEVVAPPQEDTAAFIDVMVLYTPAAANSVGGTSAINAMIANAISLTNTSYANSDVAQRLRLAHSESVSYSESGSFTVDLNNLTGGVGALAGVAALRNTYRADVVTLMNYTPATSVCGVAWLMTLPSTTFADHAYNVVDTRCAISILGFSHELGHNLGLRHDWYLDNGVTPYSYAHGYVNAGTSASTRWRTPMAYSDKCVGLGISCPVIPYWSNPMLTYNGAPLGAAGGTSTACTPGNLNNPPCDADEHRVLNNTAFTVANFRQSGAPLSVTSLTPNVTLPVTVGTPITWTATTSGGILPVQYQFWSFTDGSGWSVAQAYSANNSYTWFPSVGTHALEVWVKNSGSTAAQYDAELSTGYFSVVAPTATLSALRSDVAFPAPFKVPITFTATATANAGAVEYKFVRFSDSTGWAVARDYSSNNVYSWYPPLGTNVVQVWVRAVGSTAAYQDYLSTDLFNVVVPAPRISAIQANVAFPAAPTSTITWTVLASGGAGPLEYKFHRFDQTTGTWTVLRDWSQNNQASWTPGPAGVGMHWLQVWVRTVGSSATYDDWRSTDSFLVTPTEVSLTSDRALTGLHLNDAVTWTAAVAGAPGPWEFKFVAYDSTGWRVLQDYSPQTTLTWFPPASTCALQVWVRRIGSNAAWELYQSTGLFVVSP